MRGVYLTSLLLLAACDPAEIMEPVELHCSPTGRALDDTGVYLGPHGCSEVTLYAVENGSDPVTTWTLKVGWPMDQRHSIRLHNQTTDDDLKVVPSTSDVSFTLHLGPYSHSGLEVFEGVNTIDYELYDGMESENRIVETGTFSLTVATTSLPRT